MLLILLLFIHAVDGPVDPVIWAGGMVGQGFYSGGRLVANSIAGAGKITNAVNRQGARRAARASSP